MLLTSKDNLGLGLKELGVGILGSLASTLALSSELQIKQSFPTSDHQGGGKPLHIKMTLFGLHLIQYQPHLSIFESF
jgi:hypothetical protein